MLSTPSFSSCKYLYLKPDTRIFFAISFPNRLLPLCPCWVYCSACLAILSSLSACVQASSICFFFADPALCDKSVTGPSFLPTHQPISPAPRNWRRRPGRPRYTVAVEQDLGLRQFNLGIASGLRRVQNKTAWRTLTGTATSPKSSD